ncbi:hypothetical protein FIBSPDRAFT_957438 [Athelia psychrophila]|uniref:Uncharacterized protein n=1 Tax=Athelia psychrophila TaxID=1759441 RepID=A0A166FS58_9AGAM|nr:hypothetical protein FIBSPDRAFT_957438 [Fibularhizoctonia sp. CBS 109695]
MSESQQHRQGAARVLHGQQAPPPKGPLPPIRATLLNLQERQPPPRLLRGPRDPPRLQLLLLRRPHKPKPPPVPTLNVKATTNTLPDALFDRICRPKLKRNERKPYA